jgi:hypothetical protein
MLEPAETGQPFPRAFLRIAGASLAQHQLGLVLSLDCQRLICLARGTSPELIALQHGAEAAGLRFHIVAGPQQLSALVTANDELIVITEGLFADGADVSALLSDGRSVVLALPDDGAVAEGFERLDINNAAAGLIKIPGSLVERLHDLPSDCDTASALTRVALQSGAQMRQIPLELRAGGKWKLVRSEAEALAIETEWLRTRMDASRAATLSDRIARISVLSFGSSLLHAGNASAVASIGVVAALVFALVSAWLEAPALAFGLIAAAWVLVRAADLLRNAERHAYSVAAPAIPRTEVLGWLVDASLVAVSVGAMVPVIGLSQVALGDRIFAPLMLILMLHLVPRLLLDRLARWICDRGVLSVLLGVAAVLEYLGPAVRMLAVGLTLVCIVLPPRRTH